MKSKCSATSGTGIGLLLAISADHLVRDKGDNKKRAEHVSTHKFSPSTLVTCLRENGNSM